MEKNTNSWYTYQQKCITPENRFSAWNNIKHDLNLCYKVKHQKEVVHTK